MEYYTPAEDHTRAIQGMTLGEIFEPMYANEDNLEHDLHKIDAMSGETRHERKKHHIHWGIYKDQNVVVKIPKGHTGAQLDNNKIHIHREINTMKSLVNPNLLRLIAFDDTTLVAERFKYSATVINNYLELATIARGCMAALEYMHTLTPCIRHGNVHAKHIFLEKDDSGKINRVVLGGLTRVKDCTNTEFTGDIGYTPTTTSSTKVDDVMSLGITLINAYFNTRAPDDVGVYITHTNSNQILQLVDPSVRQVLNYMIHAHMVPSNKWEEFLKDIQGDWSNIIDMLPKLKEVSSISPSILNNYGTDVLHKGVKMDPRSSKSRGGGIRKFSMHTDIDNGSGISKTNPPNRSYYGIITLGFQNRNEQEDISDDMSVVSFNEQGDTPDNASDISLSLFGGDAQGDIPDNASDISLSLFGGNGQGNITDNASEISLSEFGVGNQDIDPDGVYGLGLQTDPNNVDENPSQGVGIDVSGIYGLGLEIQPDNMSDDTFRSLVIGENTLGLGDP